MSYAGEWAPREGQPATVGSRGGINTGSTPMARPSANLNSPTSASASNTSQSRASSFFSSFRKFSQDSDKSTSPGGPLTSMSQPQFGSGGYSQTYDPSQRGRMEGVDEYGRPKSVMLANEASSLQGHPQQGRTISGPSKLVSPRMQAVQQQSSPSSTSSSLGRRGSSFMKIIATKDANGTIHPEIQQVVGLTLAHSSKVYCSGPLVRRIERNPDGSTVKDAKWVDVWAQLGGTTLSVWDMEAIKKASEEGREEPPAYINVTDSHVQVLGSVMNAATSTLPEQRHSNVVTINTAGSNLILFACPTPQSLLSWATALRLAAWEKSRIEEIYTGHLFRLSMMEGNQFREPQATLQKGKLEGWAKVRISGTTEWQRLWVVVTTMSSAGSMDGGRPGSPDGSVKKNRLSGFLGGKSSTSNHGHGGSMSGGPALLMYPGNKSKDKKKLLYTTTRVTQAFAVYPERPEVINASSLFKIEATIRDDQMYSATSMRPSGGEPREGYAMFIPEVEPGKAGSGEMIRWLIAIHDAFRLYGRPESYTWDPRNPRSMFFTYPYGPYRDHLFLDRELAEVIDPRVHEVSRVRGAFMNVLIQRMQGPTPQTSTNAAPQLAPLNFNGANGTNGNTNGEPQQIGMGGLTTIRETSTMSQESQPPPPPPHDAHAQQQQQPPPVGASTQPVAQQSQQIHPPAPAPFAAAADPRRPSPAFNARPGGSPVPGSPAGSYHTPARQDSSSNLRAWSPGGSDNSGRPVGSPGSGGFGSPVPPVRGTQTPPRPSLDTGLRTVSPLSVRNVTEPIRSDSPNHQQIPSIPSLRTPPVGGMGQMAVQPQPPVVANNRTAANPAQQPSQTANKWGPSGGAQPRPGEASEAQFYDEPAAMYMLSQMEDEPPEVSPLRDLPPQPLPPRLVALERQRQDSGGIDDAEPSPFATNSNAPSPFASTGSVAAYAHTNNVNVFNPGFASGSGSGSGGGNVALSDGLGPAAGTSQAAHPQNASYQHNGGLSASPAPMSTKSFQDQQEDDANADALAALTFVDAPEISDAPANIPKQQRKPSSPTTSGSDSAGRYQQQSRTSSFAPNTKSVERLANAEAQYAAKQESRSKPGRTKGKAGGKGRAAWASSDEEEEEEEEDSEDERPAPSSAKHEQKPSNILSPQPQPHPTHTNNMSELSHTTHQYGSESRPGPSRRLPAIPGPSGPGSMTHSPDPQHIPEQYHSLSAHGHHSRPSSSDRHAQRRQPTEALDEFGRRVPTEGSRQAMMERPPQAQTLPNRPMWSTLLDPQGEQPSKPNQRDPFVTLEPNETMTMAFTPQGLLQAGMQDKQNRSAKQQEAHARETGASLINVPTAPPPPQMGLVGAITAHQREREREGGVGAALTERERERRMAEERQRKYDEMQKQQLERMSMGGMDMQQGYNPMMLNPMMGWGMGMPMMYPGMGMGMGGGMMSPQQQQQQQYQMWAAQQAAMQAYQQTMMNLSQAGSQAASEAGDVTPGVPMGGGSQAGTIRGPSPNNMNMGWGGMPMGSPMMSPMMMPPMMPGMGMMGGMMPGYGMGGGSGFMQSPAQSPLPPLNDDPSRMSFARTPTDSPQPSKQASASRENYAS